MVSGGSELNAEPPDTNFPAPDSRGARSESHWLTSISLPSGNFTAWALRS
jgi:hypothetical protein